MYLSEQKFIMGRYLGEVYEMGCLQGLNVSSWRLGLFNSDIAGECELDRGGLLVF
jgi:hypothetical protein